MVQEVAVCGAEKEETQIIIVATCKNQSNFMIISLLILQGDR